MYISVLTEIKSIEKTFTYSVFSNIENIKIGERVLVPFGNKNIYGFIIDIVSKPEFDTKEIIEVIDDDALLNDELLKLGKYMKNTYLCSLMNAYQTMLPSALKFNEDKTKIKYVTYIEKIKDIDNPSRGELNILVLFNNNSLVKKSDIKNKKILNNLIEKGILKEKTVEIYRLVSNVEKTGLKELTIDQKKALEQIKKSEKTVNLLRGVTGSGKTEIYMYLIKEVLSNNKNVIVLVPEISLTTQLINRFRSIFDDIAILHSGLSSGEKYDEYRKIKEGKVRIVIGTRSAIFSPLSNIGLIIIDECHDQSFKQENDPRYDTIDIAIERCKYNNAKLLLGSATPTISMYAKAKVGRYELITLDKRINDLPLPKVEVIDMKDEIKKGNSILSSKAIALIKDRLDKKEQIMILINRRGYSNYMICNNCGEVIKCPNCDITLTYHKSSDTLRCHYCGYGTKKYDICPKCKEKHLILKGIGTEKIEEYITNNFNAKVIRMDRDTTSNKGSYEKIINDFNSHKYDILLGTQMIAKGFDFPLVTLAIVLNGDSSLNIPDYKSAEETFNLLTQTSGRSGRKSSGLSIIQTYNPTHYSIVCSKNHDYESFYNKEIVIRKKLNYPPFCNIVAIRVIDSNYEKGLEEINNINKKLKDNLNDKYTVLGPSISLRINNNYKFQLIVKYKDKELLYNILSDIINYSKIKKIKLEIDFNPVRL